MQYILGVKFRDYGQVYFYTLPEEFISPITKIESPLYEGVDINENQVVRNCSTLNLASLACGVSVGDFVLAETGHGLGLGTVVHVTNKVPSEVENVKTLPSILRPAVEDDLAAICDVLRLSTESFEFCSKRITVRELDMKLIDVEILFDKNKYIFYFTAPTRIDFRELVKDLVREYHARIELRQIGVRHETQMVGAVGNCGMTCCCRRFLRKFAPVTIKMAKEQNLFLNPAKISGVCSRLLCCLSYEQENYDAFYRESPRLGKRYNTKQGEYRVLRTNMFTNSVVVGTENGEELEFKLDEWKELRPKRLDNRSDHNDNTKNNKLQYNELMSEDLDASLLEDDGF